MSFPDWYAGAACRGAENPELFFTRYKDREAVAQAKTYCKRCPVQVACLETAIKDDLIGIWGGLTDRERHIVARNLTVEARTCCLDDCDTPLPITAPRGQRYCDPHSTRPWTRSNGGVAA